LPGDFCIAKFGRAFAHGLIVLAWPLCIHSHYLTASCWWTPRAIRSSCNREMKVFVLWPEGA
jgi:hypothetical protein